MYNMRFRICLVSGFLAEEGEEEEESRSKAPRFDKTITPGE